MENIQEKVWRTEQEILDVVHKICIENNLKYSLAYGTLIGAVRHQGFIPWDDDIDIMMPRDDYEKLLKIWNQIAPKGYILQDYHTDNGYTNNFAKIRKDNTTFLQDDSEREKEYHKGIFIDIFPGDRKAKGKIMSKIQFVAFAVNLLYSRGFSNGATGLLGQLEKFLLNVDKKKYFARKLKAEKLMTSWKSRTAKIVFPCTIRSCKWEYPADLFDVVVEIPFNGKTYYATKKYDEYLRITYGDYMKLPPEDERVWTHHPIIVDFNHNYETIND